MAGMLETPSRIWRRIEAVEDRDMPSLPSLPPFEDDSEEPELSDGAGHVSNTNSNSSLDLSSNTAPIHSTPAASSHGSSHYRERETTAASTIRPTQSAARFASSINSRSTKSSLGLSSSRGQKSNGSRPNLSTHSDSFDISIIPSLPGPGQDSIRYSDEEETQEQSRESVGESYLPPPDEVEYQDMSVIDEEGHISAAAMHDDERTPQKRYEEYAVSLRSEPKASPFDKFRNVSMRKPLARTRTPSLSRTTPSPLSSPTHSTPQSNRSIAFPRSNAGSPVYSPMARLSVTTSPAAAGGPSPVPGASIPLPRSQSNSPAIIIRGPGDTTPEMLTQSDEEYEYERSRSMLEADEADEHTGPEDSDPDRQSHSEQHIRGVPYESGDQGREQSDHVQTSQSEGGGEPTFSSEEGPSPPNRDRYGGSPNSNYQDNSGFTSPAQSATLTPTPAFPRPRARFNVPAPPNQAARESEEEEAEAGDETAEPLTPHTRRRSFLLSVINSTTRPRFKQPTPHPRHMGVGTLNATPSSSGSGNNTNLASTASPQVVTAFAGITPRPAKHPLSQNFIAASIASSPSTDGAGSRGTSLSPSAALAPPNADLPAGAAELLPPWSTPGGQRIPWTSSSGNSPYDAQSFISTASSHDLTTHHRANASFDPGMGFGAQQGHGLARFNATKLNSYLHGLNRRLQEENENLVEKLRKTESQVEAMKSKSDTADSQPSLSAGPSRRSSTARRQSALVDVKEDVSGEGWVEERAELEEALGTLSGEKRAIEEELQLEKDGRKADKEREKERLKERMEEVQQGMEKIVMGQDKKLREAEQRLVTSEQEWADQLREVERHIADIQSERDDAIERASKAERNLESGKELGGELRVANERIGQVMGDLRNANAQIKGLEEEVMRADTRVDELESQLKEENELIANLEQDLQVSAQDLAKERGRVHSLDDEVSRTSEALRMSKEYVAELELDAAAALERLEAQEEALSELQEQIEQMELERDQTAEKMEQLQGDAERATELVRQMEEALEAAEKKMWADEDAVNELKTQVASLERERDRLLERSVRHEPSLPSAPDGPTEADLEALEQELDGATSEIARLSTLLNQSPARKAMDKAKDAKIELLEREKEDLLERVKNLRSTVNEIGTTPSRMQLVNGSGISPIHRQVLSMSMRQPRTPGAPLRDMSWLNNTQAGGTTTPLVAEISRLQRELDRANDSIDDKLDKLEDAGLGVVGLTKHLDDARAKIVLLEEEISRLCRKEDRRIHRLERARCQKCLTKVDLKALTEPQPGNETPYGDVSLNDSGLATEPPTPPTKTTEALRANLRSVNSDLTVMRNQWETEKRQLLGEKAVLQDAANKLNTQVRTAQNEAKRAIETGKAGEKIRAGVQNELDHAQRVIADLEGDLQSERARLRTLTTEQDRVQRDKDNVLLQLQRTESDMDDVKDQLQKFKRQNHELEAELRVNANADQKARLLEVKVMENVDTIEQLRQERGLLAADHKELQRRFSEISEHANRLRDQYASQQTAHDNKRQQLDLYLSEINDLRRQLADQASQLERTSAEKERIAAEKNDVARTVSVLTADLQTVRRDAEIFGRDLKLLRRDKERLESKQKEDATKAERVKKQTLSQIRLLNEQLDSQKDKTTRAREELKRHVCAMTEHQLLALKQQHGKECKGLFVQLGYLKCKFVREAKFREGLIHQKEYLLLLLAQCDQSDRKILAKVAEIGFPVPQAPPKPRSLKNIALAMVFVHRAKSASQQWREQSAPREAVAAAHEDVRRRRRIASS